ncbi:Uncharacterised protein [Streptococcus pneumoniae]|nr:Uncharacterised protein [Streptococcus pneumoniae]
MYSLKAVDELSNEKEYNVGTNTPNDILQLLSLFHLVVLLP